MARDFEAESLGFQAGWTSEQVLFSAWNDCQVQVQAGAQPAPA